MTGVERLSKTKKAANPLLLRLAQLGRLVKAALAALRLVEEHVAIARLSSHDLPRAAELKPLRRRLAGLQLWHSFSCSRRILD